MENEIYIEGYGGTIPAIPISAKTGEGVPDLLDMMLLVAEMEDLTGDREALATGTIIESNMDPKKGISATLIIKDGTLHKGSYIVSDDAYSPVRIMENFLGESIDEATFSSPVQIIGWNKLPKVGKMFIAVEDKKTAEAQALKCKYNDCEVKNMMPQDTGKKVVPIIIRTDSAGSSEAVASEVNKILCDDRICTHILYTDIGAVSETDVKTALSNEDTVILAFHTKIDPKAEQLADRMNVEIQSFDIIYKLTEWLTEALEKRKPTSHVDKVTGGCKVLKIFSQNKKDKQVIGAKITEGILKNKSTVKIMRKDECVATGTIKEMQQQKMDVDQVAEGEFGMLVDAKTLIETGDTIVNFISVEE